MRFLSSLGPLLTQGLPCCLLSCMVTAENTHAVKAPEARDFSKLHLSSRCCHLPHKSVLRNHCTYVGTSQMCAAISVRTPCPGEVSSSTWITPACAPTLAAHAHSYMLPHQFSSLPGFPTRAGVEAYPKPHVAPLLAAKHLSSRCKAPSLHL